MYDDALPVLAGPACSRAEARPRLEHGAGISTRSSPTTGSTSTPQSLPAHGKTKPHESIFRVVLERLDVRPEHAAMVGDSVEDDVEGARALGMRAFLLDRLDQFRNVPDRLPNLLALPAALGLAPR